MNKIQILFLFAFPLVIISCNNEVKETKKNNRSFPSYKLVGEEGEVLVESFDSTIVDENKYNYNNQVFRVGTEFVYRYEHVANDNEVQYFKRTSGKQKWDFVNENDADSSVVRTVKITVENGNPISTAPKPT